MKLNLNILILFQYLILFHGINSLLNNNTNKTSEVLDEETIKYQKIKSEYYKNFYSGIKPVILTDENYTKYINSNPYTLIYLHSPFDIHSQEFIPTFKFIHNYLNSKNNTMTFLPIRIAAIDLIDDDNNSEMQAFYRLSNFPYLIIYSSMYGNYIEYTGYMTAQSIITFCTKATMDNIVTMNNEDRLKNILNPGLTYMAVISLSNKFNFDEYFQATHEFKLAIFCDCIRQKKCLNYLNDLGISNFIDINNTDIILAKYYLCENDFVCDNNLNKVEYKKQYFIPYNYTTYENFIEFISLNIMPPLHNLTDFNFEITKKNKIKTLIYIKSEKEKKSNKEISFLLEKIIKEKKYGIKWGSILDPINSPNDYEMKKLFSIEDEDYLNKSLVIIYSPDKILSNEFNIYRLNNPNKELNEEIIINFVNMFNSGYVKKDIKSELIPKFHPKKNLRMVVGKSFNKEILNNYNKTNVLILLTLNMKNLHVIENQIESLTIKFSIYNETIIFNFLDPAVNEMPNMPKYNILEKPFYRYYYKNKKLQYTDFTGNSTEQSEIEDWIIENYAKEYGLEQKYGMRMHIDGMTELLKDEKVFKELERKAQFEQIKEDFGIQDNLKLEKNVSDSKETDL